MRYNKIDPVARSCSSRQFIRSVKSLALGAALMYVLDPDRGHRRRTLIRDKTVRKLHQASRGLTQAATDAINHGRGLAARARAAVMPDQADDWIIRERIRSAMGRATTHPSAISVSVRDGCATLSGPVLEDELEDLLSAVRHVRGVRGIKNRLDIYDRPGGIPGLQGRGRLPAKRPGLLQGNWSPATRVLLGGTGAVSILWALRRRDWAGMLLGAVGGAFVLRSLSSIEISRFPEISEAGGARPGRARYAVTVRKSITLAAPIESVFRFFSDFERFPYFMSNVREVRPLGSDRWRWVVAGPMGVPVSWDARLTRYVPYEEIAWHSLPGAVIENAGTIQFQPVPDGTRVDIRLAYSPPAGAIGHLAARLFGADPKSEMDADLARVKRTIETGRPPHDAAKQMTTASSV